MKVLRHVGRGLGAPSVERVSWLLRGLSKQRKIKQMGEKRLQKSSDLFHLGRTWFKLEAELKGSVSIGFLTPE